MKKLSRILILIMILLPALAHAGAIMEFERMDYDFGSVEQGRQLRYDFRFTNVGDEDLLIKTISPSWGVTAVRTGRGPLKPGDSDSVSVFVDTEGRSGELVKTVRVSTNDPANNSFTLVIKARVEPPSGSSQSGPK